MSHDPHEGPHVVFADNCGECQDRVDKGLLGFNYIDSQNMKALGKLAIDTRATGRRAEDASLLDMRAVRLLLDAEIQVRAAGL